MSHLAGVVGAESASARRSGHSVHASRETLVFHLLTLPSLRRTAGGSTGDRLQ